MSLDYLTFAIMNVVILVITIFAVQRNRIVFGKKKVYKKEKKS